MTGYDLSALPRQHGRRVLVTGGNSGIGFEAAVVFASLGAEVLLACRDPGRASDAVARAVARSGGSVRAVAIDLSRLASVRACADALLEEAVPLDVLVNNAGVMALPFGLTEDGFERQVGTNHFGHFALTLRLLPLLEQAAAPRVVTVSSLTHTKGSLDLDHLHDEAFYSPSGAYAASKLANLLFAYELERRLRAEGARTRSVACHPGMSATHITAGAALERGLPGLARVLEWGNALVAQPASEGALPTVHAALADVPGASYVGPTRWWGTRGLPGVMESSPRSRDAALAAALWARSEAATGLAYPSARPATAA